MEFQKNETIRFQRNLSFIDTVDQIHIQKYHQHVRPKKVQFLGPEPSETWLNYVEKEGLVLNRKNSCLIDFGDHCVGRTSIDIQSIGSPPDAPVKLHLSFGETLDEVIRKPESYTGELSASWIQEELLTVDVVPATVTFPRRFAFRYICLTVIDTSPKYHIQLHLACRTESSANSEKLLALSSEDEMLNAIDLVAQKTLVQCMQDVFEDGPKRDRRLWLGDLRLQALANYATFKENDLVKKCLYLFAAETAESGQVAANVFVAPKLIPDDTFLADYSLFFIDTLLDYFKETNDQDTLRDLYNTAVAQGIVLAEFVSAAGEVCPPDGWWAFIDWNEELNKKMAIQAIYIYSYKKLVELTEYMHDNGRKKQFTSLIVEMEQWAMNHGYSEEAGLFVDPDTQQISVAAQAWMVLAEVGSSDFRKKLLQQLLSTTQTVIGCNTPYMYHHYVEALLKEGFQADGLQLIKSYWGGMIEAGADTFWEVYNPQSPTLTPYGDSMINSYCHAWSCTPCYLLRKYL